MSTVHETIGWALDRLVHELAPVVERELHSTFGANWRQSVRGHHGRTERTGGDDGAWDAQALLAAMWDQWNAVFRTSLGLFERSLVSELREFRNRWAHQGTLTEDDAYRVVDTVQRLLRAVQVPEATLEELERVKLDLLRRKLDHAIDAERRDAQERRERRYEMLLIGFAGASLVVTTLLVVVPKNPLAGLIFCIFSVVAFGYILQRRSRRAAVVHSVHECPRCDKIIYQEVCPYCEATPVRIEPPPPPRRLFPSLSLRQPSVSSR